MVILLSVWMAQAYPGIHENTIQRALQFVNRRLTRAQLGLKKQKNGTKGGCVSIFAMLQ